MNPNRLLRQLIVLLLAGVLAATVLQGCSDKPEEPTYANPFDPGHPTSANPFDLTAIAAEGRVLITWLQLDRFGFVTYQVQHRVDGGQWTILAEVEAATGPAQYDFRDPVPTATNYFRIVALDEFGFETATGAVVPVPVDVPPIITNAADTNLVASRYQDLTIRATAGDVVEVSLDSLFGSVAAEPRDESGETLVAGFDLGEADNDTVRTFVVYARTVSDLGGGLPPVYSGRGTRTFDIGLAPTFALAAGGATVAAPVADLQVSNAAEGVARMRFATSEAGLADAVWQPGAEVASSVPVLDTPQPQTVWAEFERDFGFVEVTSLEITADDLASANFVLDLPSNRISETPEITFLHDAVATHMRSSQYPDFNDVEWVAYADTSTVVLAPTDGQYFYPLFTQYRNHWYESPVRSDFALLGPGEVRVDFTNPQQDLIVEGGTTIEVTGTANTYDAELPLTAVDVHLGDGWQPATGTENWEIAWDVPLLTADTQWAVGALATAENAGQGRFETGTAWITVTISQLTVAIAAPLDAAEVTRGLPVTINGTAAPFLAGAPLDSVVVAVLDQRLAAAAPLVAWSVDWLVPDEGSALIDIVAWAYAGGDSVSQRVQVTAVDPER